MNREYLKSLQLPDVPGVYFFRGTRKEILYVGKAASLGDRVPSYFSSNLVDGRGPRIVAMVESARSITWKETGSVLEALILEANLIKKHQPPYNVDEKDNKSFNYLISTKEEFPRFLIVRGRELFGSQNKNYTPKTIFGPFPHGNSLKEAIKIVRRIFPFRDTCTPCREINKSLSACKPCFNRQIGLCPGVCSGEMSAREYALRVKHISQFFSGNMHGLKRDLERDMKTASKREEFELAKTLRRQILALQHIRDVSLIKDDMRVASGGSILGVNVRIEAYDVAHTAGRETVAVMTVVENGEMIKNAYRKFKIRTATNNDVAALKETLSRRLSHPEWPLPRVIVVDGALAQLNAVSAILRNAGISVPVVGVVKDERHKPLKLIGDQSSIAKYERDILRANSEAHRFAITFHRARRSRAFL